MNTRRQNRIRNALWGLFAGDALAMPAHWFYSLGNLRETFAGGVTKYEAAPHPHPESFMVGMGYHPDVETAKRLGRPYNTLHDHLRFYDTSFSNLEIETGERESEHGNSTPKLEDRYHYHHGLKAGENTTAAQLVRVLIRLVAKEGRYDEDAFLREFVAFMTTPGNLKDPYQEIYLRSWFENYSRGYPIQGSAERQRKIWSIGSHGGMIRPMVLSLLAETDYQALGFAIEHQNLTHRSENVAAALGVTVPLLQDLISGKDALEAAATRSSSLRVPRITGKDMFAMYRDHKGPGNIPHRKMWELHVQLSETPFDLREFAKQAPEDVVLEQLGTVCYPEHGLPLSLYFAAHHGFDPEASLLGNTNAGGDNVHRNAVLGLTVGAATDEFPEHLIAGLADAEALASEIDAFVEVAANSNPW
ncbi:MAG: ADP-ribosylglycohydrolase family protein [Verrucomicrobiota bacterium]